MDLTDYRNSALEQARIDDLMSLLPQAGESVLDVGARDGYLSKRLASHFTRVTALDLEMPSIDHAGVTCVKGDITALRFPDSSFDLVFCAEVLEHIPPQLLPTACRELARVSASHVLVGVPYRQDIRLGRTTCYTCGKISPPWGHVNSFDQQRITALFPGLYVVGQSFVGKSDAATNTVSTWLMDLAGNPYGTYDQEEACGHCGAKLLPPPERTLAQKVATRLAFIMLWMQKPFLKAHGNWIHVLLKKPAS